METKEIDIRLAEIELLQTYLNDRIKHLENHKQTAFRKKDIEAFNRQQEECQSTLRYLEERKIILNHLKQLEVS